MVALRPDTTLRTLLEEYPFLLDYLAAYRPPFALLQNPLMRATVGRAATLGRVAEMGGVSVETLLDDLAREIERHGHRISSQGRDERFLARQSTPVPADLPSPGCCPSCASSTSVGDGSGGDPRAGARRDPASDTTERTARLKELVRDLHRGLPLEEGQARFEALVGDISPAEIAAMEKSLIQEGVAVSEIQRLCDLHVALVKGSLDRQPEAGAPPGHPVHTYRAANKVIQSLADRLGEVAARLAEGDNEALPLAASLVGELAGLHLHYLRKEHQLFPFLERHGIVGPSEVMWGVHDEIRAQLKAARAALEGGEGPDLPTLASLLAALAREVGEMVYKENRILLPMALQTLRPEEWVEVRKGEDELGYAFAEPAGPWPPEGGEGRPRGKNGLPLPVVARFASAPGAPPPPPLTPTQEPPDSPPHPKPLLSLGTGKLTLEQVDMILRHLPVDLSFVDAEGFVRYYSEGRERIFPRTPAAIGRHVENCHPPKSVHMVREILRAFAAGERDVAEFWITLQGRFVHIRYFAVRNLDGKYLGCLEVTQDVTEIRALEGERRLLQWT